MSFFSLWCFRHAFLLPQYGERALIVGRPHAGKYGLATICLTDRRCLLSSPVLEPCAAGLPTITVSISAWMSQVEPG